jgi:hypothetical protein
VCSAQLYPRVGTVVVLARVHTAGTARQFYSAVDRERARGLCVGYLHGCTTPPATAALMSCSSAQLQAPGRLESTPGLFIRGFLLCALFSVMRTLLATRIAKAVSDTGAHERRVWMRFSI